MYQYKDKIEAFQAYLNKSFIQLEVCFGATLGFTLPDVLFSFYHVCPSFRNK